MGHSVDSCCEHLLWLEALRMDQDDFRADAVSTTQSVLDELHLQNTTTKPINPFRHSGVKFMALILRAGDLRSTAEY